MPSVAIILTENFPILSLTLVTEPLRVANRELATAAWQWQVLSVDGGAMRSSSGMEIQSGRLDDVNHDVVLLISSYAPEGALTKPLLSWLRRRARKGSLMGCVDTGAMIFAEAGLLTKTPAAFTSRPFVDIARPIPTRCSWIACSMCRAIAAQALVASPRLT